MRFLIFFIAFFCASSAFSQTEIVTLDIKNFYTAFDSVHKQTDRQQQLTTIENIYIKPGSDGLKSFVGAGGANPQRWLNYMMYSKRYLTSIRPQLESVEAQAENIQKKLSQLKKIYPGFRDGKIYVIVGCGLVGGSPIEKTTALILGAEVLVKQNKEWVVPAAIHEFVHLQQQPGNRHLLTQTIAEGVAEFLSELFFGKSLATNGFAPHLKFGMANEKIIWNRFVQDMFVINNGYLGWLYNSKNFSGQDIRDLGYFVGYQICKTFYERSANKSAAIKNMLELDLSSNEAVRQFVLQSGYMKGTEISKIKKGVFTEKHQQSTVSKSPFGYVLLPDSVVFEYEIPKEFSVLFKGNIGAVSIAGSFNNWNPSSHEYRMQKVGQNRYRLVAAKSVLNLKTPQQFKFVINEDVWMPAPEMAQNIDSQSGNLILPAG